MRAAEWTMGVAARLALGLAVSAGAGLLITATASAATVAGDATAAAAVVPNTTTLYDGNTVFTGVNFTRMQLNVPAAGHLEVSLKDMQFPALAGALSFALVSNGTVLGLVNGTGKFAVDLDGPQNLFGYVYGVGAPLASTASYYLNVTHSSSAAPVPLPAAVWMLLGGLGMTGWLGRRRRGAIEPAAAVV